MASELLAQEAVGSPETHRAKLILFLFLVGLRNLQGRGAGAHDSLH